MNVMRHTKAMNKYPNQTTLNKKKMKTKKSLENASNHALCV